jgi:hypothetical protein
MSDQDPKVQEAAEWSVWPWDDGDYVVTRNGKPIGCSLTLRDAACVRHWIQSAERELCDTLLAAIPPQATPAAVVEAAKAADEARKEWLAAPAFSKEKGDAYDRRHRIPSLHEEVSRGPNP